MINIKAFLNLTYYTSELDQFLADYDQTHPQRSASQCREKEMYQHIFEKHDNSCLDKPKKPVWDNF